MTFTACVAVRSAFTGHSVFADRPRLPLALFQINISTEEPVALSFLKRVTHVHANLSDAMHSIDWCKQIRQHRSICACVQLAALCTSLSVSHTPLSACVDKRGGWE